jgi:hypothetical protein
MRAIFIHGVGSEPADFAVQSAKWLGTAYPLTPAYVHWAPIFDAIERGFWKDQIARGMAGNKLQELTVYSAMDALLWVTDEALRAKVFGLCDEAYAKVWGSAKNEVTVFGHSLGCLVAHEWLLARPNVENVRLVTMADNEFLVRAHGNLAVPKQLAAGGRWWNLRDKDDGLGFAIDGQVGSVAKDELVKLSGLLAHTGLAHVRYWGDEELWRKTIPALLGKE